MFFHFFTVFFFLQQLLVSLQKACKCAIKCNATFHISPKFMHRAAYEPEFQTTVINFLKLYFSFYFIENPCKSNHMFRMPTSLPLEKCSFGFAVPVNWYLFKHGSGSFACWKENKIRICIICLIWKEPQDRQKAHSGRVFHGD